MLEKKADVISWRDNVKQHKKYDRLNIMHHIYEQAINKVAWALHENETCSTTNESIQPTKNNWILSQKHQEKWWADNIKDNLNNQTQIWHKKATQLNFKHKLNLFHTQSLRHNNLYTILQQEISASSTHCRKQSHHWASQISLACFDQTWKVRKA